MSDFLVDYFKASLLLWIGLLLLSRTFWGSKRILRNAPKKWTLMISRFVFAFSVISPFVLPDIGASVPWPVPASGTFKVFDGSGPRPAAPTVESRVAAQATAEVEATHSRSFRIADLLLFALLAGAAVFLGRVIGMVRSLKRLVDGSEILRQTRRCSICLSSRLHVPVSFYYFGRDVIILPEELIVNPRNMRIVLAHESQHIRQRDTRWAYAVEIFKALFWWNPAIYLWARRLEDLSELSCDEQVLSRKQGKIGVMEYAQCLILAAERALRPPRLSPIVQAMASHRTKTLSRRIEMFSASKRELTRTYIFKSAAVLTLLIVTAVAAQVRAEKETVQTNPELQKIVEDALASGLKKHNAESGFAILADPNTGQVLAISRQVREGGVHRSVAAADFLKTPFEPASLLKPLIAAVALEKNLVSENTVLDASGGKIFVGKRHFHDWKDHGKITVTNAIASSSFVGTIKIAEMIGGKEVIEGLKKFGIGERRASDNSVLDRTGMFRFKTGEDVIYNLPLLANGAEVVFLTVEDVLRSFSVFANGGKLVRLSEFEPSRAEGQILSRPLSEETAQRMKQILLQTMQIGTGRWAQSSIYTIMGKTATGYIAPPKEDRDYNNKANRAQFVGFAPFEKPRLISLVIVDHPGKGSAHGSEHAAPVVRSILNQALKKLSVDSDRTVSGD